MRKLPGRGYSADFWKACAMNLLCMTGQAVMFLLTLYFTHAGMTRWQVGTTDAVFWIISVLIQPWLGRRLDRWGRRVFFIWGSYLMVASILCYIYLPVSLPLMLLVRTLHGLGFSFFFTSTWTWVSDQAPPQKLTEMLGIFGVSGLLAGACGPVLAEQLKNVGGFPAVFWSAAGLMLAGALLSHLVHEPTVVPVLNDRRNFGFLRMAFAARMRGLTLAAVAMGMAIGSVFCFIAPYIEAKKLTGISYVFVCYTVAAVLTRVFSGKLATRLGATGTIPLALLMQGGSLILFSFLSPTGWRALPLMLGAGAGAGLSYGMIYPALSTLAVERSGSQRGLGMSVVACFGDLGSGIGALGAGVIAHFFRDDWMWVSIGVVVAAIAVLFIMLEGQWRSRRRKRSRSQQPALRLVGEQRSG